MDAIGNKIIYVIPSLKPTAKAPKNDGFQVRNLLLIPVGPYFQGLLLLVSRSDKWAAQVTVTQVSYPSFERMRLLR